MQVILESGTHSPWISSLLEQLGHEVVVANARELALIYNGKRKNDRIDAEKLARLGRFDLALLSPIEHRSKQAQADRVVMRCSPGGGRLSQHPLPLRPTR